ncbi:MAG: hypothetical protein QG629_18 [Patescibacteria group bacterium]|nr:hypothetical protein [Candidatus Saccharibacteria bacterium]MDQ5962936.1 hypothetical protein [Patescibacteria group bacterium]
MTGTPELPDNQATAPPEPVVAPDAELATSGEDSIVDEVQEAPIGADNGEIKTVEAKSISRKLRKFMSDWWRNPKKRYATIVSAIVVVVGLSAVPMTRAMFMNVAGVRSSVLLTVVDKSTGLPLENATVALDGQEVRTTSTGAIHLKKLHIGTQELSVKKLGFAEYTKKFYLGMRVTDFGEIPLRPTGAQLTYTVTDFLSGKPIEGVTFANGDAVTKSNDAGKAVLTLETLQKDSVRVRVTALGYRTETIDQNTANNGATSLRLVPAAKAVFISKKSGKFDVYSVDVDGKNERVLLAGTGLENQSMTVSTSLDNTYASVVSSREEKRNREGYLLNTLTLVGIKDGEAQTVQQAEQISVIGWQNKTIVFQETSTGASAANPNRQKIFSYNTETNEKKQLASANYFNEVLLINGQVYYTVSATDAAARDTFVKIGVDGSNRKAYYAQDIWALIREDYKNFKIQTPSRWQSFSLDTVKIADSTPPNDMTSRRYTDGPKDERSAWIDVRDSFGVLMLYNLKTGQSREVSSIRYVQQIVGWLDEKTIIVRAVSMNEVADYAVSTQGGKPSKIADVSNTPLR